LHILNAKSIGGRVSLSSWPHRGNAMALKHITTVWLIRQGVRFAWTMAHVSEPLARAGERLEVQRDGIAVGHGVDMLDVLEPLSAA
jgi:hypothetical protein